MKRNPNRKLACFALAFIMVLAMIPVFTFSVSAEDTATNTYEKVTTAPSDWSGTYLIVYENGSVIFDGSLDQIDAVGNTESVTISDSKIEANKRYAFTIAAVDGGYSIQGASGNYIGNKSNSNALTSSETALVNTISINSDGSVNIIGSGGAYLRYNNASNQTRFRYYKTASYTGQQPIALYKLVEDTTTTPPTEGCEHANAQEVLAIEATCTEVGYTAGKYCPDCETYPEGHEEIPATGKHNYVDGACSVCGEAEPTGNKYVLVKLEDIKSTDTIIIVSTKNNATYALSNDKGTSSAPTAVAVTISDTTILTDATNLSWNIVNDTGSLTIYPAETTDTWLYCIGDNNGVRVGTNANKVFTLDSNTGYLKNTATSRYLGVYNNAEWRCYTNTTGNTKDQTFSFYKLEVNCNHENTEEREQTDATCTTIGYEAGTYCNDCNTYISGGTEISKIDHTLESIPGYAADCTTEGLTDGQKCSVCGTVTQKQEAIPATGHSYKNGKCSVCGDKQTYYALVTDISTLQAGDKILIACPDKAVVMSSIINNEYATRLETTINDGKIAYQSGMMIVTLGGNSTDGWTLSTDDGYLAWSSGNSLKVIDEQTENSTWTISVTDGVVTIANKKDSNRIIRYNASSSGLRFACYTSAQTGIAMYKLAGDAPSVASVSATLNEGVTLNVMYNLPSWLTALENVSIVLKYGDLEKTVGLADATIDAKGRYVYTLDLTPGYINDAITAEILVNGVAITDAVDVSFTAYVEKFQNAGAEKLGMEELDYEILEGLLLTILDYAAAADGSTSFTDTFDDVGEFETSNADEENKVIASIDGVLGEKLSLSVGFANISAAYNVRVEIDGVLYIDGALSDNVNAESKLVIRGLTAVNYDDRITITVTDGENIVATSIFTFNQYLKFLYNSSLSSDAVVSLAAAAFRYGLAAEKYAGTLVQ